jgi:hypothetical protein
MRPSLGLIFQPRGRLLGRLPRAESQERGLKPDPNWDLKRWLNMVNGRSGAKWTTVGYIRKTRKGNAMAVTSGKARIGVVSLAALADLLSGKKNYAPIVTAPTNDAADV